MRPKNWLTRSIPPNDKIAIKRSESFKPHIDSTKIKIPKIECSDVRSVQLLE